MTTKNCQSSCPYESHEHRKCIRLVDHIGEHICYVIDSDNEHTYQDWPQLSWTDQSAAEIKRLRKRLEVTQRWLDRFQDDYATLSAETLIARKQD